MSSSGNINTQCLKALVIPLTLEYLSHHSRDMGSIYLFILREDFFFLTYLVIKEANILRFQYSILRINTLCLLIKSIVRVKGLF